MKKKAKKSKTAKTPRASDNPNCCCGHVLDEHGGDDEYPGSMACNVEGCDCCAYERDS